MVQHTLLPLYEQLYELTQRQAEAIEAGEVERLIRLLAARQEVIDEIERSGSKDEAMAELGAGSDREREQLLQLLEKTQTLEEANAHKLQSQLGALRERLASVRQGKRGVQRYDAAPSFEAKFFDRRQ